MTPSSSLTIPAPYVGMIDHLTQYVRKIEAEYNCEGKVITVEIDDVVDGDAVTILSDEFPRVWVRHQGWLLQPSMTVDKKHLSNIRTVAENGAVTYWGNPKAVTS